MIAHTHIRVEPAPTLADWPLAALGSLVAQAIRALRRQTTRLGGRYYSPATLHTIRDTALGEIQDRAKKLHQARAQWLANHSVAQLGHILDTQQVNAIPYTLRDVITWQTLRTELHSRAANEYNAIQDAWREKRRQASSFQSTYDDPAVRRAIQDTIHAAIQQQQ
jgi:hypothetical protein